MQSPRRGPSYREREKRQFMVYAVDPPSATVAAAYDEKVAMRISIASSLFAAYFCRS